MMVWEKQNSSSGKVVEVMGMRFVIRCLQLTPGQIALDMLQTHNEGPDNSGILRRGAGRSWSSSARVPRRFVALKVTSRPMRGTES